MKVNADVRQRLKVPVGKGHILDADQRLFGKSRWPVCSAIAFSLHVCFRALSSDYRSLATPDLLSPQLDLSFLTKSVLRVTTIRRAIPTKETYQEGGAPNATISARTAVKKKAPRIVPRMVPLPPVSRVPPITTAAIDSSSIPVPNETLVSGSFVRVTIAANPAKSEQS